MTNFDLIWPNDLGFPDGVSVKFSLRTFHELWKGRQILNLLTFGCSSYDIFLMNGWMFALHGFYKKCLRKYYLQILYDEYSWYFMPMWRAQSHFSNDTITTFKYVLSTMGVSKESISKFLIGNRFHVKLRILSPYSNRLRMRNFTWNRFPIKNLMIDSLLTPIVESTYLNRDMCKFESSQKDESRWQSTDSLKAYRNTSAFKNHNILDIFRFVFKIRAKTQKLTSHFAHKQTKRRF